MNIIEKLQEYESLLDFKDEYFGKDYKNNLKFIKYAVNKFLKQNTKQVEIIQFIQDTIDIHKRVYLRLEGDIN